MKTKIDFIDTGYFYADGGAMFGAIPKSAWSRKYPSDETNSCVLALRSMLIITPERRILIDTGVGTKHTEELSYYRFFELKDLREEVRARGVEPEEITDVVLTHLHFDHCGGCTTQTEKGLELVFPNATHWVSKWQMQIIHRPHPLEKSSFYLDDIALVEQSGKLKVLFGGQELCPEVLLLLVEKGHTRGQIIPVVQTEEEMLFYAGDMIPLMANLSPEWISAYDMFPRDSYEQKVNYLKKIAQEGIRVIYCHDAYTLSSKVVETGSGLFLPDRETIQKVGK